jgi:hypothetical protein
MLEVRVIGFCRVDERVAWQVAGRGVHVELLHLGELISVVKVVIEVLREEKPGFWVVFVVISPAVPILL